MTHFLLIAGLVTLIIAVWFAVFIAPLFGSIDRSGPATVCDYDVREEMVGKVMQRVTYTVCQDAR